MYYFSELQNKKVYSEKNTLIGILKDMVFLYEESPRITKILLQTKGNFQILIPISCLIKINTDVVICKQYEKSSLSENELFISKSLLDKQIIDLVGSKIVRVNDVIIQNNPFYCISGVDIGFLGILRRLGIEDYILKFCYFFGLKPASRFLSWGDIQNLELIRGQVKLKKKEEKLSRINAEDLADYLEKTNIKNVTKVLNVLEEKKAIEVINSLNINYQQALFNLFTLEEAARIISLLDPDEAVDILLTLSSKKREDILNLLSPQNQKEIRYLLKLSKTPIGELMTIDFFTAYPHNTIKEVINKIREETPDFSFLTYTYVLNESRQLVGVLNLHELLLQKPDTQVYKVMIQNLIVIHLTTPLEIALKKLIKYKLSALPVVNKGKNLLGVVTFDDVSEFMLKNDRIF